MNGEGRLERIDDLLIVSALAPDERTRLASSTPGASRISNLDRKRLRKLPIELAV